VAGAEHGVDELVPERTNPPTCLPETATITPYVVLLIEDDVPRPGAHMVDHPDADPLSRRVPAPGLRETADIWFDTGRDPVVAWDASGRRFDLVDPDPGGERLTLYVAPTPARAPEQVARVLATGLAACDFPPTADRASPTHVAAALRAAGIDPDAP
jgi:hypothetical protein